MINVSIIEDNPYMREGWKTILDFEKDICVLADFDSYEAAAESGVFNNTDVLLLDIELPGIHGTEAVSILKKDFPELLVLMVTVHDDNEYIFKALKNGAIGYLQKKVSPSELIEAVKSAVEGGSPMSPTIARKVIQSFHTSAEKQVTLSEKEQQILNELAEGKSYKGIASTVYLSIDGVRYHIRNIYKKLEARNSSEAVAKAISLNLVNPEGN